MIGEIMQLNLLYQFNEKYVPYAGVSIYSALWNNRHMEKICVYVLGENINDDSRNRLRQMVSEFRREIIFINTETLITKMKSMDMPTYRGSYAANMRLFLDEVLDTSIDRVLYLDADTIVNRRLDELLETELEGKTIGMALESLGVSHKKQIGLSIDEDYYNSGVILFDMEQWRNHNYSQKIAEHVKYKRNNYPAPDQDLLNVVCRGDIKRLDAKYNFQPFHAVFKDKLFLKVMRPEVYYSVEQLAVSRESICIYHCFRFIGEFPWHKSNVHPYNSAFDFYLKKSPWKNYQKIEADTGFILKIEKALFKVFPKVIFLYVFKLAHALFLYQSNRDSLKNRVNKLM